MKAGDKVKVYYNPLDEEDLEGEVKLLRFQYTGGWYGSREMQWWEVRFSDGQKCMRKILAPYEEGQ